MEDPLTTYQLILIGWNIYKLINYLNHSYIIDELINRINY